MEELILEHGSSIISVVMAIIFLHITVMVGGALLEIQVSEINNLL